MKNIFGILIFAYSVSAFSWGDLGHSTVGYIAEYKLSKRAKNLVYQILGPEPLSVAAVFPDHVRSDNRYNGFVLYHFLEVKLGRKFTDLKVADRADKDADTIISSVPELLMDKKLSRDQKMILLRYFAHIVGDVHQPLHIGNGLDRGGNLCDVKWVHPVTGKTETDVLHSFWDDKIMTYIEDDFHKKSESKKKLWFGYREFGDALLKENLAANPTVDYDKVSKDEPKVWYDESQDLHPIVYPLASTVKPKDRAYCKTVDENKKVIDGIYDASKIPILSDDYIKNVIPVVRKRILQAGFRLAGVLNQLAEKHKVPEIDKNADAKIFDPILIINKESKSKK